MCNKKSLRTHFLEIRGEISARDAKSAAIAELLFASEAYKNASEVLTYASVGSEVDTFPIIRRALCDGKAVALPAALAGVMRFYRISGLDGLGALVISKYGIPEPVPEPGAEVRCGPGTLLMVPGVVFGKNRYRIGYGGGYYDRYLAANRPMMSVGLCFAGQVVGKGVIPAEAHDIRLDAVLTEEGWVEE